MLRIASAFLAGHVCVLFWPALPPLLPWLLPLAAIVVCCVYVRAFAIAAACVGLALAWHAGLQGLQGDIAPALEGEDVLVRGEIVSIPEPTVGGVQFELALQSTGAGLPRRVQLSWYERAPALQPGERWQLLVRMKRRHGFANPGGFDYERHLFRLQIGATGYVREGDQNLRLEAAGERGLLLRLRAHIAERLRVASEGHALAGVLQGLAVGVQHEMTTKQWEVFAATGTTHLMAISGLHIGMVAALFAWIGGQIVRRCVSQSTGITAMHGQATGGLSAAVVYCALAGMSVPTQRTLLMIAIYFAVRLSRRLIDVPHGLGLALIAVLLIDPFAPMAPGAWLSFLAVAAILMAMTGARSRSGALREAGRVQLAVTVGLLPVVMAAFGNVSMVSPLANALAVPVFTFFLVPATLIASVVSLLSIEVASWLLALPLWVLEGCWWLLERMSRWPLSTWHVPGIPLLPHALLGVGTMMLLLPSIWPLRLSAVLLCLPALTYSVERPAMGEARVDVLDVGQGLAVVVSTATRTLVYDTGPAFRSGRDTAEMVLLPFLWHHGVGRLDALVVSHSDQDHAGGLETLSRHLPVDRLLLGPSLTYADAEHCHTGQQWHWDGVSFEILHPDAHSAWGENDSSCVLLIRTAGASMLLTGDVEAEAEEALLSRLTQVDALTIAHHGSRTSSIAAFVEKAHPAHAIASAGYRNRWGFPKDDVVARWQDVGATVMTTAHTGAIRLQLGADGISAPQAWRDTHRRFWRYRAQP